MFCVHREPCIVFKIFAAVILVCLLPHLLRQITPVYNGEDVYFPILKVDEEENNNKQRLKDAVDVLDKFDWNSFKKAPVSNFSISIIASDRGGQYLTQSVAFLLKQTLVLDKVPNISICNVEPTIFKGLDLFTDKLVVMNINRYKDLHNFDINKSSGRIQKEAHDYWTCLQAASSTNSRFVLLLEDDAVVVPHFFTLIDSLIYQLEDGDVDYVKMFHPWTLRKIPFIFQASATSVLISSGIALVIFKRVPVFFVFILSVITYLNFRYINYEVFADLRFHLTSAAYMVPPESCCTPAVLFRSSSINQMVEELSKAETGDSFAKDHVLDESRFVGRGTDFNYVVHIGHFSSIRQKTIQLESLKKTRIRVPL